MSTLQLKKDYSSNLADALEGLTLTLLVWTIQMQRQGQPFETRALKN
jgi:hypothetical protein